MAIMKGLSGIGLQLVPADVSLDGVGVNLTSTGVNLPSTGASIVPAVAPASGDALLVDNLNPALLVDNVNPALL